jgi:hypothetical protein
VAEEKELTMIAVESCESLMENIGLYVDGTLSPEDVQALEVHLELCETCRNGLEHYRAIKGLAEYVQLTPTTSAASAVPEHAPEEETQESSIYGWLQTAPWWGVSMALHLLLIALASLITMSMEMPNSDDKVIAITEMLQPPKAPIEPEKPKVESREALNTKQVEATDINSHEASDIMVPPDVLARAQLGDHFETVNPDRDDTHSAYGTLDSKIFYSDKGVDEPAGGGGMNGIGSDDVVGVGGTASVGRGSGFGGGDGNGIGLNSGGGKGSFGNRNGGGRVLMVRRHGGSKVTESAVDHGLEWLAKHQEADGHWDAQKYGAKGTGRTFDAAMTGYAVLAFLGAGHTEKVGKYKDNVVRGVEWLINNQKKEVKFDGRWVNLNYTNGIATMALGEAAGMAHVKETREAAQAAINAVDDAQRQTVGTSDREAWDYGPRGGCNDSSVMAWNILALKSCKVAKLKVDHACFQGCLDWINAGQDLGNLKPGDPAPSYDWEGGLMSYRGTVADPKKGQGGLAVTAAAALCRMMIGGANGDDPGVLGPCNLIKNKHIPKAYPFNMYYGYYATLLMFQKGGEHWKAWNEAIKKILPDAQAKGGDDDGSWAPDANTAECRVMSTALCTLCLEVYYRYAQLNPENK